MLCYVTFIKSVPTFRCPFPWHRSDPTGIKPPPSRRSTIFDLLTTDGRFLRFGGQREGSTASAQHRQTGAGRPQPTRRWSAAHASGKTAGICAAAAPHPHVSSSLNIYDHQKSKPCLLSWSKFEIFPNRRTRYRFCLFSVYCINCVHH